MLLYDLADRCIANIASFLNGEEVSSLIMTGCSILGYKLSTASFSLSVINPREKVALSYCHRATELDLKVKIPPALRDNLPPSLTIVKFTNANWECISRLPSSVTDLRLDFETSVETGGPVLFPNVVKMLPMTITKAHFTIIGKKTTSTIPGRFAFDDSVPDSVTDLSIMREGTYHNIAISRFPSRLTKLHLDGESNATILRLLPTTITDLNINIKCSIDDLSFLSLRKLVGKFNMILEHPELFPDLTYLSIASIILGPANICLPSQLKRLSYDGHVANWGGCVLTALHHHRDADTVPKSVYAKAVDLAISVMPKSIKPYLDNISDNVGRLFIKGDVPLSAYDFSRFTECFSLTILTNVIPVALPPQLQYLKIDFDINVYALKIPQTITTLMCKSTLTGVFIASLPMLRSCICRLEDDILDLLAVSAFDRVKLVTIDHVGICKIRELYSA